MRWPLTALLLISPMVLAYELREMSFDEKVQKASVILIGTVDSIESDAANPLPTLANVKVESVMKGSAPTRIQVQLRGSISEQRVFVSTGSRYLFLLNPMNNLYVSVNGRFGAVPVAATPAGQ